MRHDVNNYHLIPNGARWNITSEDGKTIQEEIEGKEHAVSAAIHLVRHHGGSLKIHRSNGTIEEERTYPRPEVDQL